MNDTRDESYAERLQTKSGARWKQVLDVQAPYRWNLRRQDLGRTLDVGCGIGRNLGALPAGSIGVDHNVASIAAAREAGYEALTTEEWEQSPLRVPESFDSILLAHVAEHMDHDTALEVVGSYLPYLKKGGTVFFICPQERGYATDATHVEFVDFDGLRRLSAGLGLKVEKSYSFPFPRIAGKVFPYNEFCVRARPVTPS